MRRLSDVLSGPGVAWGRLPVLLAGTKGSLPNSRMARFLAAEEKWRREEDESQSALGLLRGFVPETFGRPLLGVMTVDPGGSAVPGCRTSADKP